MKSISLDFNNNCICIMTKGQQGTEIAPDIKKAALNSFIPEQYRDRSSFTWNFENDTFCVNQPYVLHSGCIMSKDCFIPEIIIPMPGLGKRYNEFLSIIGYKEEYIDFSKELLKLFGLS